MEEETTPITTDISSAAEEIGWTRLRAIESAIESLGGPPTLDPSATQKHLNARLPDIFGAAWTEELRDQVWTRRDAVVSEENELVISISRQEKVAAFAGICAAMLVHVPGYSAWMTVTHPGAARDIMMAIHGYVSQMLEGAAAAVATTSTWVIYLADNMRVLEIVDPVGDVRRIRCHCT
jgi:hypothetical protein